MKLEKWIPGWKATNSEMKIAEFLNEIADFLETKSEVEQLEWLIFLRNHYDGEVDNHPLHLSK